MLIILNGLMSSKIKLKIIYIICVIFLSLPAIILAQDKDFGIWYSAGVQHDISEHFGYDLSTALRTRNNAGEIGIVFLQPSLSYKINDILSADATYRVAKRKKEDHLFHLDHTLFLDFSGETNVSDLNFGLRLRYMALFNTYIPDPEMPNPSNTARVRLLTSYDIPSKPFHLFASGELFFPFLNDAELKLDKSWLVTGIEYSITEAHSVEIQYMHENYIIADITDMNVISLAYQFSF